MLRWNPYPELWFIQFIHFDFLVESSYLFSPLAVEIGLGYAALLREYCQKGNVLISKKRTALVFFGLTGSIDAKWGLGEKLDPNLSVKANMENFIIPNNADVFIHTWSQDSYEVLSRAYDPKVIVSEPMPEELWKSRLTRAPLRWWTRILINSISRGSNGRVHGLRFAMSYAKNSFFRYQSHQRALQLLADYSRAWNVEYDFILLSRLDLVQLTKFPAIDLSKNEVCVAAPTRSWFSEGKWNYVKLPSGDIKINSFSDLWFGLSSRNLDKVMTVGDNFFSYNPGQHRVFFEHVSRYGLTPKFMRHRGFDFELTRISVLNMPR